jgi:hypothetical protein
MRPTRIVLALLTLGLLGLAPPLAVSEEAEPEQDVALELATGTTLELGFGTCQWLHPMGKPGETLAGEPVYRSARRVYYLARFGDSEDDAFTLVIDESRGPGTGHDTLYVDGDNDNRIDPETERFAFRMSTTTRDDPVRIRFRVTAGGETVPYEVGFTAFPYKSRIHANLRNSAYRFGEAKLEGRTVRIAIADLNSNGLYGDVEMGLFDGDRFFPDRDRDGRFRERQGDWSTNGYPYGGVTRIGSSWYRVEVRPDGGRLRIRPVQPVLGAIRVPTQAVTLDLRSKSQPAVLTLRRGTAPVVAGTYEVRSIRFVAKDERDRHWRTEGTFLNGQLPRVEIVPGETTELEIGPPLRVRPVLSRRGGAVEIDLVIHGRAGEDYRWQQLDESIPKPWLEIRDEAGEIVHRATFEYG